MGKNTELSNRYVILGGRRGLGRCLSLEIGARDLGSTQMVSSRKEFSPQVSNAESITADLSKREDWPRLWSQIQEFGASHLVFCAGGGPYGKFGDKDFKDHLWALNVSFVSASFFLHQFLSSDLRQMVGSHIAEEKVDPMAASYCASKHALLGLISSVQNEYPERDIRLFSPTYLDTDMLPSHSAPREQGLARSPESAAKDMFQWMLDPEGNWHYKWNP